MSKKIFVIIYIFLSIEQPYLLTNSIQSFAFHFSQSIKLVFNHFKDLFSLYKYTHLVRTSQETRYGFPLTEIICLMLFKENIAVYFENHKKHTNTSAGKMKNLL
jgi:hypothetical protein